MDTRSAGLTSRQGELLRNEHIRVGEERAGYAGYELPSWLVGRLRHESRVPDRVKVEVGPSERAGVVPKGGRLRERGTTY